MCSYTRGRGHWLYTRSTIINHFNMNRMPLCIMYSPIYKCVCDVFVVLYKIGSFDADSPSSSMNLLIPPLCRMDFVFSQFYQEWRFESQTHTQTAETIIFIAYLVVPIDMNMNILHNTLKTAQQGNPSKIKTAMNRNK